MDIGTTLLNLHTFLTKFHLLVKFAISKCVKQTSSVQIQYNLINILQLCNIARYLFIYLPKNGNKYFKHVFICILNSYFVEMLRFPKNNL